MTLKGSAYKVMTYEPSPKSDEIDELLTAITGVDRRAAIMSDGCTQCNRGLLCRTCQKPRSAHFANHGFMPFRDPVSEREYTISGMCQSCQDEVFSREDR